MDVSRDIQQVKELVEKYQSHGPRYTSYPTAADFSSDFSEADYRRYLQKENENSSQPWSIYVHVPFCWRRCHFCACSVVATSKYEKVVEPYLKHLEQEMAMVSACLPDRKSIMQIHFGGGTPSYLTPGDLARVYKMIEENFWVEATANVSIELDPRVTCREHIEVAAANRCRRVSIGVQDFDRDVQRAIGREQTYEETRDIVRYAREYGVKSINVDLVYGLPSQSVASLLETTDRVHDLGIDRVALFGYAHLPIIRGNQRRIASSQLPQSQLRLEMFMAARAKLQELGYMPIGLDHFASRTDGLYLAKQQGTLSRNFMGYIEGSGTESLGFGVTAIGEADGCFVQNTDKLSQYYEEIGQGKLPVAKGLECTFDDLIRGRLIHDLMCFGRIERARVCERENIGSFQQYFGEALKRLSPMIHDGLVFDDGEVIRLSEMGQLFVRNVAMCFDVRSFSSRQPVSALKCDTLSLSEMSSVELGNDTPRRRRLFSRTV